MLAVSRLLLTPLKDIPKSLLPMTLEIRFRRCSYLEDLKMSSSWIEGGPYI